MTESAGNRQVQPGGPWAGPPPLPPGRRARLWENLPAVLGVLAAMIGAGFFSGCQVQQQVGSPGPRETVTVTATVTTVARPQGSGASSPPTGTSTSSTAPDEVQWTGSVRLGDLDLDTVPPQQSSVAYADIGGRPNGILVNSRGPGPAVAPKGTRPTRQECATLVSTQARSSVDTDGVEYVCLTTDKGRVVLVEGFQGDMATVTVWAK
ncbi:hypothetical protein [Embleya sp. NBC_00896]|uniref:hypothetical protein n=1 Tax=Embleya sp. NBC_00896 TaxID=2975961 RepID=UPI002F906B8F|nr:hypothetical protein OG928_42630 [Embleya sp. NBC_00896]